MIRQQIALAATVIYDLNDNLIVNVDALEFLRFKLHFCSCRMFQEIRVEQVRVEVVRRLRGKVLRPGLPAELSVYPSDALPDAQHFAAWFDNQVVGVASIFREQLKGFENEKSWRLRGMAVDPNFQGKGIGKQILRECLNFIEQFDAELLWCNGRAAALGFYRSLGFKTVGAEFDIPPSGAHFVMILQLEKLNLEDLQCRL